MSEWREAAACANAEDPDDVFFDPENFAHAKAICATCPVRRQCLDLAVSISAPIGVWGGLTAAERAERGFLTDGLPNYPHGTAGAHAGCKARNRGKACHECRAAWKQHRSRASSSAQRNVAIPEPTLLETGLAYLATNESGKAE